jgi:glycerol uptake facilitator protein
MSHKAVWLNRSVFFHYSNDSFIFIGQNPKMMNEYFAEFLGTALLIVLGGGVNAGLSLNKSYVQNQGWIVVALGWGLSVTLAIYAVGQISGAHINPAVTLGLWSVGEFPLDKVPGYIIAQVIGGMTGAVIVWLHYLPHWAKTEDSATKLGVFSTGPAIPHTPSNLLSEIIGTAVLTSVLMMIGANKFTEGLNPIAVGALIVAIGVSLGGTTGYAINPARDLGPRIAHFLLPIAGKGSSNWSYAWIPVIGPIIGGIEGAVLYRALFQGEISALGIANTVLVLACIVWALVTRNH